MTSLLRAYIITAEDVLRSSTWPGVFPPPECEWAAGYEFAHRGEVMTVLLQYLQFAGVIPRSVTKQPCPEAWKELDGPPCIEEAILTGAEAHELLACLEGYALDEEGFRCYACRYITGQSADPEPAVWEVDFLRIARVHLSHFTALLRRAESAAWFLLLNVNQ
jgi:hypothetical protein